MLAITARWSQKGSINGSSKEEELGGAAEVLGEVCLGYRAQDHCKSLLTKSNEKGLGQRIVPACAVSHLPSGQKDPYSKLAYFGVAYSKSLQLP